MEDFDLWYGLIARTGSRLAPVGWIAFNIHMRLFAWSCVNADAANPVHSPVRDIASVVFAMPLSLCPSIWNASNAWAPQYRPLPNMVLNALCWELLSAPLISPP